MSDHRTAWRRSAMFVVMALTAVVGPVAEVGAQEAVDAVPVESGPEAIEALELDAADVADDYDLSSTELRSELREDDTLHVDANGELLYVDPRPPGEPAAPDGSEAAGEGAGESSPAAPPTTDPVFLLHSRPGADHTIHLDFDGHTTSGTSWNSAYGVDPIVSPPYDIDGDPASWSAAELSRIASVWDRVAEDFSPFDVDVTTQEPDVEALRRTSAADGRWGTRVVVTDDTFAGCGCGGHAYIGSFDDGADEPVFVYNRSLAGVAEASSHEVGHALSLAHDGTSGTSYYRGHGSGSTGWAPLMGASYEKPVTQWSAGEYVDANNNTSSANYGNGPDDLAVIAALNNGNGFGYRPDDHGGTATGATALVAPGLAAVGVVERTDDVDVFSFTTSGGAVNIDIDPASGLPNLDIRAQLLDSGGSPVADSNDSGSLSAGFDLSITAGTYFITVEGTGVGAPSVSPPTGYTQYGSIGQYIISGTANVVVDSAVPSAEITSPADQGVHARGAVVTADYGCTDEPGGSGLDTCVGTTAAGNPIDTSTLGPKSFTVTATDNAGNTTTVTHTYTVDPIPGHGFDDVASWLDEAVDWLVYHGHATGYPDNTFRPGNNITRGQAANIVHRIAGSPPPGASCGNLTDVPAWAADGICWLVDNGHATGYPDNTFRPGNNITRGQIANTLYGMHG